MPPMKRSLSLAALAILLATVGFWWSQGAHTGWSQNRVPVSKTDEVTGINFTAYEERFVPGIEVLGAGAILSAVIFGSSFFIRSTPKL